MTPRVLTLTLIAVLMSAVGQIMLKSAVEKANLKGAIAQGLVPAVTAGASSIVLWAALALYGVSVLLWLWVLTELPVSLAYPLVSLGFIVTLVLAAVTLGEPVTPLRVAGVLLIVAGCFLVGRSA